MTEFGRVPLSSTLIRPHSSGGPGRRRRARTSGSMAGRPPSGVLSASNGPRCWTAQALLRLDGIKQFGVQRQRGFRWIPGAVPTRRCCTKPLYSQASTREWRATRKSSDRPAGLKMIPCRLPMSQCPRGGCSTNPTHMPLSHSPWSGGEPTRAHRRGAPRSAPCCACPTARPARSRRPPSTPP
jgi:hypothetical protein